MHDFEHCHKTAVTCNDEGDDTRSFMALEIQNKQDAMYVMVDACISLTAD